MTVLWVALGAALGAPLRFLTGALLDRPGRRLPWGTLTVNAVGSLLIGLLIGAAAPPAQYAGWATGFCGGLTTFSTFGYETWQLIEAGAGRRAVVNVVLNLTLGIAAVALGWWIGTRTS